MIGVVTNVIRKPSANFFLLQIVRADDVFVFLFDQVGNERVGNLFLIIKDVMTSDRRKLNKKSRMLDWQKIVRIGIF